jgi:predicted ABC-type sugar transport system permease subunit
MTVLLTVMAVLLFLLGVLALLIGLGIILSREYMEALRSLTRESSNLGSKAAHDAAFLPILEGASRLVDSVTRMVQTAMGVGAFLCLLGIGLCTLAYWMLSRLL